MMNEGVSDIGLALRVGWAFAGYLRCGLELRIMDGTLLDRPKRCTQNSQPGHRLEAQRGMTRAMDVIKGSIVQQDTDS